MHCVVAAQLGVGGATLSVACRVKAEDRGAGRRAFRLAGKPQQPRIHFLAYQPYLWKTTAGFTAYNSIGREWGERPQAASWLDFSWRSGWHKCRENEVNCPGWRRF